MTRCVAATSNHSSLARIRLPVGRPACARRCAGRCAEIRSLQTRPSRPFCRVAQPLPPIASPNRANVLPWHRPVLSPRQNAGNSHALQVPQSRPASRPEAKRQTRSTRRPARRRASGQPRWIRAWATHRPHSAARWIATVRRVLRHRKRESDVWLNWVTSVKDKARKAREEKKPAHLSHLLTLSRTCLSIRCALPKFGRRARAFSKCGMASRNLPACASAAPRSACASGLSGCRRMAAL